MERLKEHIERYVDLTKSEWASIRKRLTLLEVKKREVLVAQNGICDKQFFVLRGCLRAYEFSPKGKGEECNIAFAIENQWITDLESFLNQTPANFTIDAMEDSFVLSLTKQDYDFLIAEHHKFELYIRLNLQDAYIELQKRLLANISMSGEELYVYFLDTYPQLESRLPLYHIASFLGITPESLSRIRKKIL